MKYIFKNHILLIFVITTMVLSIPSLTWAQQELTGDQINSVFDDPAESNQHDQGAKLPDAQGAQEDESEEAKGTDDLITFKGIGYRKASFFNMVKFYWAIGLPDIKNNEHVDTFIQLMECDLYEKYHENEFEWGPLRETMREYLKENSEKFAKNLYFDLPLEVGIYNVEKDNFVVLNKNFNSGVREFFPHPVYLGWNGNFCGYKRPFYFDESYPRDALFLLTRPISIPNVKVDPAEAQKLVKIWAEKKVETRYLAIRLYINYNKFLGYRQQAYEKYPVYLASLGGYEVYSDFNMNNLLYTKSFKIKEPSTKKVNLGSRIATELEEQAKESENSSNTNKENEANQEEKTMGETQ